MFFINNDPYKVNVKMHQRKIENTAGYIGSKIGLRGLARAVCL